MRLGRYELLRRLALGGMAELFLARASGVGDFHKLVVLKRILPQLAADEDFRRMFLDEARLAATLHHPNIAQVFDVGCEGGEYFFAMEYAAGRDLGRIARAARERREEIPLDIAVAIVMGIAAGLHYAHEMRDEAGRPLHIVHRDVSPSNVIVGFDGSVKLVDFGIAKAATQRTVTREGLLKGKVAYMSPEQCMGRPVDRRSDVFALGILLYELTTGTQLFTGESDYAILHQIADVDVRRPSGLRPGYPPALEAICLRALRRNPDERCRTAEELQIDLETFAREAHLVTSPIEVARFMREQFPGGDSDATAEAVTATGEEAPLRWRGEGELKPFALPQAARSTAATAGKVSRRFAFGAVGAGVLGSAALFVWWRKRPSPAEAKVGLPAPAEANVATPTTMPAARAKPAPAPLAREPAVGEAAGTETAGREPAAGESAGAAPAGAAPAPEVAAEAPPRSESQPVVTAQSRVGSRASRRKRHAKTQPAAARAKTEKAEKTARAKPRAVAAAKSPAPAAPKDPSRPPAASSSSPPVKRPVDLDAPFPPF